MVTVCSYVECRYSKRKLFRVPTSQIFKANFNPQFVFLSNVFTTTNLNLAFVRRRDSLSSSHATCFTYRCCYRFGGFLFYQCVLSVCKYSGRSIFSFLWSSFAFFQWLKRCEANFFLLFILLRDVKLHFSHYIEFGAL